MIGSDSWAAGGSTGTVTLDETIRVAIARSVTDVRVSGDAVLVTSGYGVPLEVDLPLTVRLVREGLELGGNVYSKLSFSAASTVQINNRPYRGLAELAVVDNSILIVNQLPLEEYLVGLINSEISSAWPIEAVKAQAVIARTYALNRKKLRSTAHFHLESTVLDQVYGGYLTEDSRARRAVQDTAGEVLTFDNGIIQAYYHSSCGARTEASENVWGQPLPYLKGVECQYCLLSPTGTIWEQKLTLAEIESRLRAAGHNVSGLLDIKPGPVNSRGRLKNIAISAARGGVVLTGDQFRKAMGYGVIKSTRFNIVVHNREARFSGTGNGHGVGLCQWGAKQRALDGFGYTEILSYYYPGTLLKRVSDIAGTR